MTLISRADRTVPVTVQARTTVPPATAFEIVVPIDLPAVFLPWGLFPGVRGVRDQTGSWDHVGAARHLDLTDGSTGTEVLTEYHLGYSFAYEVTGFTNPLGRIVVGVRGEWTFTADGDGTLVRWTYEFKPRRYGYGLVRFGLATPWRGYMRASLARIIAAVGKISA